MTVSLQVRRNRTSSSPNSVTWSSSLGAATTMNEGASVVWTISVNLGAYTPAGGEIAYITATTPSTAEFTAAFPGQTQATVAAGDFASGWTDAMATACAANTPPITCVATTIQSGSTARLLGFPIGSGVLSVSITRQSVERAGDNGDRRLVHSILLPSLGTLAAASDSVVIEDISVAPGGGDLSIGELSASTLDVLITSPDFSPPNDTVVGTFIGKDSTQALKTLSAVTFATGGDSAGRFKITGTSPTFQLRATGVLADFEDPSLGQNPRPLQYYTVAVNMTSGAITLPCTFKIRPKYPYINPTGGAGGTLVQPTTMATLYTQAALAVNKNIDLGLMSGVHRATGLSQLKPKLTSCSIVGYPNVCMRHGRAWMIRDGNDVVIEGMAFRVGAPATVSDVDSLLVGEGATDWVRNMHIKHCSFSSSNDELMRVNDTDTNGGFASRHIRLSWCMFYEAFHTANHSKGNQHNHGPALSGRCQNIVMDHCIIGSNDIRNPRISRAAIGVTIANCFIFHWLEHANYAGIDCVGSDGGDDWQHTSRLEGNLFYPVGRANDNYGERNNAIFLFNLQQDLTSVYIPNSGTRRNHFCNPATDNFADDPLVLGNGITMRGCSLDFQVNTGTPPFEWAAAYEADLHPTQTEAQRRTLFGLLMNTGGPSGVGAGNDSQYDQDIKALIMAGTTRMNVTPVEHDSRYGAEWDGVGGSLGHGVC